MQPPAPLEVADDPPVPTPPLAVDEEAAAAAPAPSASPASEQPASGARQAAASVAKDERRIIQTEKLRDLPHVRRPELTAPRTTGDPSDMQRFFGVLVLASGVVLGIFQGCTSENNEASPTTASAVSVGPSTGVGSACAGNFPDGICTLLAAAPETCDCPDCQDTAGCTGRCMDDGNCNLAPMAEDCTCADCYGKVPECAESAVVSNSATTTTGGGNGGNGGTASSAGGMGGSSSTNGGSAGTPTDGGPG